ncbi:unnamed protein product [Cylindrotheca closterium]|nr:unnamed protein product [Cylindrotheca closterium]
MIGVNARVGIDGVALRTEGDFYGCEQDTCGMRKKVRVKQGALGKRDKVYMEAGDELELIDDYNKTIVRYRADDCAISNLDVVVQHVGEAQSTALLLSGKQCNYEIKLQRSRVAGEERDPVTGKLLKSKNSEKTEGRALNGQTVLSPGSGNLEGFVKINFPAGLRKDIKFRIQVRGYSLAVQPATSALTRTIYGGSDSGNVEYRATANTTCTATVGAYIIQDTAEVDHYVMVQRLTSPVEMWRYVTMDVFAECSKTLYSDHRYVSKRGATHKGAEIVEYDAYGDYNGVFRTMLPGDYGTYTLLSFDCSGLSPEFNEDRCAYASKPSYVADAYNSAVCGGGDGTSYSYDQDGNIITRRLTDRELQTGAVGFLVACAVTVGKATLADNIGTIIRNGPMSDFGPAQAIVTASVGFVQLSYDAITTAAEATPEGILTGLVCGTAYNVATLWWGKSISPGWGQKPNTEEAYNSEGLCST